MLIKRLVMWAVTTGLAAKALQVYLEKNRQQRAAREKLQQREAVQRWEDEGGNLRPQ